VLVVASVHESSASSPALERNNCSFFVVVALCADFCTEGFG